MFELKNPWTFVCACTGTVLYLHFSAQHANVDFRCVEKPPKPLTPSSLLTVRRIWRQQHLEASRTRAGGAGNHVGHAYFSATHAANSTVYAVSFVDAFDACDACDAFDACDVIDAIDACYA